MRTIKQYDLSGFNKLLNDYESPRKLADDIVQLLFNYASVVNESTLVQFREDVGTLFLIHNELINIE